MTKVNISEAKAHFSSLVARAVRGEEILICKRNVPLATLAGAHSSARPLGMFRGAITYSEDCFAPLTPEELQEWGL